ncbi:MAG TPA: hypothetical protein VFG14_00205, partial [Chthoniobacteraceae bacterium]|nr:hypothetical protein [Chthoniobacteraceae bacterium]
WQVSQEATLRDLARSGLKERLDEWAAEANKGGRILAYEKKGPNRQTTVALLERPGVKAWSNFTVPMSMREVEPGVRLIMSTARSSATPPDWTPQQQPADDDGGAE